MTFCTMACMDHAQCKSYNFQETENVAKLCELNSSTETASSTDLVSRPGYSYSDAEVIIYTRHNIIIISHCCSQGPS